MRSKHLFFAVALMGTFSACTNELVENVGPSAATPFERPTVEGVTIAAGGEAATRVSVSADASYKFDKNDEMSVILMDENTTNIDLGAATSKVVWDQLSWLQKYTLVDYAHTDFKFTRNEDGSWSGTTRMLEGNYFLTVPYSDFNGEREPYFDLTNQVQEGNDIETNYAKNQRFVGYAKIAANDVDDEGGLNKVKADMVPVLAPIRIDIVNEGTRDLEIQKIVLRNHQLSAQVTIDPTRAEYGKLNKNDRNNPAEKYENTWNLKNTSLNSIWDQTCFENYANAWGNNNGENANHFNYANYLEMQNLVNGWGKEGDYKNVALYNNVKYGTTDPKNDYVYNIDDNDRDVTEDGKFAGYYQVFDDLNGNPYIDFEEGRYNKYYYAEAIRRVVQPLKEQNYSGYDNNYAQLTVENCVAKSGDSQGVKTLIMTTPFDLTNDSEDLILTIYTNRGIVKDIYLNEIYEGNKSGVRTDNAVLVGHPEIFNRVTVFVDDDAVSPVVTEQTINNEDDLKKLLKLAVDNKNFSKLAYNFTNDITIDEELYDLIKAFKGDLHVSSKATAGNNLRISAKCGADVLEMISVKAPEKGETKGVVVEVLSGAKLDLTADSRNVLIGARENLAIQVNEGGVLNIKGENTVQGGYNTNGELNELSEVSINNFGTVNVNAAKTVGIEFLNRGLVNVYAPLFVAPGSENTIKGVINVGKSVETNEDGETEVEFLPDASLSGTTRGNLINRGTIENYAQIWNIVNETAAISGTRPGTVYVMRSNTYNGFNKQSGWVVNDVLEALVDHSENGDAFAAANNGRYFTTRTDATHTSELNSCYITDATIVGANLTADEETRYLNKLYMESKVGNDGKKTAPSITDETDEKGEQGQIVLIGEGAEAKLKDVSITDVRFAYSDDCAMSLSGDVKTFGTVEFGDKNGGYADIYLRECEIVNDETLGFGNAYAGGTNSNIYNKGKVKYYSIADNIGKSGVVAGFEKMN